MNLTDEQVRELILSTGFKKGDAVDDDVAPFRAERDFDSVGQLVDTAQDSRA